MSCLICAENFNGTSRKVSRCEFCEFEACLSCCKTFILNEPVAKCMAPDCNKEWTRKFLVKTCGQTFVTKPLKKHREEVLYDKERSLLPATQPYVEKHNRLRQLQKEVIKIDEERKRLAERKLMIRDEIMQLRDTEPENRVVFTRACPANCRGFLNTQLKCGLCNIWACAECHEVKGETRDAEHVCNPETVATVKLLAADTKGCPTCHTKIHKIDGCDQMWCTMCHTAFSWRSGKIETKIHNPHYYEYMRNQSATGEIPRENECPQVLTHMTARQIRQKAVTGIPYENVNADMRSIETVIQKIIHLEEVELTGVFKQIDEVAANRELRVDYMRGITDETRFKTLLQRNEKNIQKRREIRNIFQMVVTAATDVILRLNNSLLQRVHLKVVFENFLKEIQGIRKYANEELTEVTKTYKCTPIALSYDMTLGKADK
uniref:RING-type domain-containing protein n=1 Tax=viral metagenome TaxID=1070528 RepID=A0A6C0HRU8_9ZZZZ